MLSNFETGRILAKKYTAEVIMEVTTHTEAVGQEGYRKLADPLTVGRGKLSDPQANAA